MKAVLNAEPYAYSKQAESQWVEKGYAYLPSSWDYIDSVTTVPEVQVLIVRLGRKVDDLVLSKFPNLKTLISSTTGHDHLDVESIEKRKIRLVTLRGQDQFLQTIPSTAEHTWALLLALLRNLPKSYNHVKEGKWNRDLFRGNQLKDKIIGIVGLGRTGKQVAKYAVAFGMNVIYYDPFVEEEKYLRASSLKSLLQVSDIITLHVHLSTETENIIDHDILSGIKPGAFLINTSRGKICDEKALVNAFEQRDTPGSSFLGGVATDVLSSEFSDITSNPLWLAQQKGYNIIITPHVGGATWEAMWACEEFMLGLI